MKIIRLKIVIKLLLVVFVVGIMGCSRTNQNLQILDHNQLATQYYQNDAQWFLENIPFFECSDKQMQDVYYYRWKMYKAHIRNIGEGYGYAITEFLDHVDWDREPYCTVNISAGLHIYEGRWLKDGRYMNGFIDYLYKGGGNNRMYSDNIAEAAYARHLVNSDTAFLKKQLGYMVQTYNQWADSYDQAKQLYYRTPNLDVGEWSIAPIDASGGKDGYGAEVYRPTINCYMYANALAISRIAAMTGDSVLSREYRNRASVIKAAVQQSLWNETSGYFTDRYRFSNERVRYWDFVNGRELSGYFPWRYNMPDNTPKYNAAWKRLTDSTGFMGEFGLRTVEPSYPNYMKQYVYYNGDKPGCQFNGPSWPFHTAPILTAMANLLNNYNQNYVTVADYVKILKQFTQQHYDNGLLNIQQNYNPETGKPIVAGYLGNHYNHSTYNDLIITGLCGIRPSEGDTLTINPLVDGTIKFFYLEDVPYHGHKLTIRYDADGSKYQQGKGLSVFVDGKKAALKETAGKYEVEIGAPIVLHSPEPPVNYALNIQRESNYSLYDSVHHVKLKGYPVPSASVNNVMDSLANANDGRVWYFPENNKDNWTTFGSTSTTDWYALNFGQPREISSVKIYLFADGKTYGKPDSFNIEYFDGNQWHPVKEAERSPLKPVENTVNTVVFDKVSATQIRVNFKHEAKGLAVAVAEVECY